jgi:hypothetical protein
MKRIVLRSLPWLVALLGAGFAYGQFHFPLSYPWLLVIFLLIYVGAFAWYAGKRKQQAFQSFMQFLPSCLFLLSLFVAFLLVESPSGEWLVIASAFLIPLLTLELLYLALFETFRYPVNGLSRWNLSLVPAIAFLLAVSGNGLHIFLRLTPVYALIIFPLVMAILYDVTAHPTAEKGHRLRWGVLGGAMGLKAALLVLLLPIPLLSHGALAALLISAPLRIRRYAYAPMPSKRHAWVEGTLAAFFFMSILLTSPWA